MEFLSEYGLFLAKSATVLVSFVLLVTVIASISQRNKKQGEGHIEVEPLHERFEDWEDLLKFHTQDEASYKKMHKDKKKALKLEKKGKGEKKEPRKRLYVLDFDGDIKASEVELLRHEISAILTIAKPGDEVLLRLESPGGMVHSYGLAASQLQRITDKQIPLTIAIDRVAASGGYMMACIGNRLLAAPFAVIGSIGVVAQLPNFHRLLKKHDVDVELHTAGDFKRTLTMIGENTDEGRKKFVEELEDTHNLFKEFVKEHRPQLDIEDIATGEVWYGRRAIDKALIDDIQTSDDYLLSKRGDTDIFSVRYRQKKSLAERVGVATEAAVEKSVWSVLSRFQEGKFWQ
ncbi:ClpP class periplasmic serine protease [Spongiibacter sp. IMCC21906]|uniref:protease SohB n=1 Tax=Spongiibacter sp. IMCC21906 TaxID=1620392 RepID=UPI00062DF635|nr:protease SohB [Spongiibacter sp. IMCC21906]AKH69771.1 ClpP class periplasmic serine protease [Spongiibacter sp. IMCC21906]